MSKRMMILLVALIPFTSVCMGILMLVIAFSNQSDLLNAAENPLSKTSWQEQTP